MRTCFIDGPLGVIFVIFENIKIERIGEVKGDAKKISGVRHRATVKINPSECVKNILRMCLGRLL